MLQKLHESHMGVNKTQKRAKQLFYWPGMSVDVENVVLKCQKCLQYQRANVKEPMIKHETPEIPFDKVGCDILE
ncbi:hypothetical protein GUG46_00355, partial [Xanthomonas citri pv. citri]|nr:hypothetical protein [Xanthomonas citri pv. citri]